MTIKDINVLGEEMQNYLSYVLDYVERYNKQDADKQVAHCAQRLATLIQKEPECEYGHQCTSGCQKDFDCPCEDTHCCSMSQSPCGDIKECEFCASKVPDLADLQNDTLNER